MYTFVGLLAAVFDIDWEVLPPGLPRSNDEKVEFPGPGSDDRDCPSWVPALVPPGR